VVPKVEHGEGQCRPQLTSAMAVVGSVAVRRGKESAQRRKRGARASILEGTGARARIQRGGGASLCMVSMCSPIEAFPRAPGRR
jgi:hypothetical protein